MRSVNELIQKAQFSKKERWKIRRLITIGRFYFARLVMYHDLSPEKWPGNKNISTHKIVQRLFGISSADESRGGHAGGHAEDYDIDTPEVEEAVPLLITSADASQHSALVDVMQGKNIAITGPPGTGKSQTITNIIANALARGKTVLFLAEKMAALNVVYKRLREANLGPYCLELHSEKAKKTQVLKSIEDRLRPRPEGGHGGSLAAKTEDFKWHRDRITEYVNLVNSQFGRQDKPIRDYLGSTKRYKDRIGDDVLSIIKQCRLSFAQADLSVSELIHHTRDLENIASLKQDIDAQSKEGQHPWGFVRNANLTRPDCDDLKPQIERWKDELVEIQSRLESFNKDFSIGNTMRDIHAFCGCLGDLMDVDISLLNEAFIADLGDLGGKEKAAALTAFVEHVRDYRAELKKIQSMQNPSAAIDNLKEIENDRLAAEEMKADTMTALDMRAHVKDWEEELKLWDKNLERLLPIGAKFGVSKNDDLDKIYALAEVPDDIASVPPEYLRSRTDAIMDEVNAMRLKAAADTQERIRASLEDQEEHYDLSMMGQPREIRMHAAALDHAGWFPIFKSSYRQAKKVIRLASKQKTTFNPEQSAITLRAIADNKEEKEKIDQDNQLRTICGSLFKGIRTDFKMLQGINEWASRIRQRYASGDEFSREVRSWLLKGDREELESVREWARDDLFSDLKSKIANIKDKVAPDTPIEKYLDSLGQRAEKLKRLKDRLQDIAADKRMTFADIANDLPHLHNAKQARKNVRDAADKDSVVKKFFGNAYKDAETDVEDIEQTAHFIHKCLASPMLKSGFDVFLNRDFSKRWESFTEQLKALTDIVNSAKGIAEQVDALACLRFGSPSDESNGIDLADLIKQLSEALDKPDALNQWVRLNRHIADANETIREPLLQIYDQEKCDFATLPDAFNYIVYCAVVREIYQRHRLMSDVSGIGLEKARAKIKELDQDIMKLQQQELCNKLDTAKPVYSSNDGRKKMEGDLIDHEIGKQKKHIPIRELMKRANQSIQKIKPCFLMSPLAVAQYLDPGAFEFDLVVIDEASQMHREDALGSIARTDQIVVVGDPKQLPPTSFFQSAANDDDDDGEEDISGAIMDMALSAFRPSRMLSRHYRSQHESLIAFSNHTFYDDSLVLFPSPVKDPTELGVRLEEVGGTYMGSKAAAPSKRGSKRGSNMGEVEAVVQSALTFMKKHPDRSLGIVTMNKAQEGLIELEMDRAFLEHRHATEYKAKWQDTLESFFVKSLENVQGDERDAIFISTVYGPDKNGAVMQRFGPINNAGGHRRLNVLFSRAKKNMVVFTSLKPEDIKITPQSNEGVKALKGFLTYAQTGILDQGQYNPEKMPDSDFEVWVKEKLESIGCEAHPQVGVGRYRIDLGVKHPRYPYGYLMGVECDGATYHSSQSARERDSIRQQVLEGRGWHIYRIWSTDWFSDPVREFEKLENYIQQRLDSEDLKKSPAENNLIEHDFTPHDFMPDDSVPDDSVPDDSVPDDCIVDEKDEEPEDSRAVTNKQENADDKVQLLDTVTYFMTRDDGKKEKRVVKIVPYQGHHTTGSIATKYSAIGRALLGACKDEEIECTLSRGAVTLQIVHIDRRNA